VKISAKIIRHGHSITFEMNSHRDVFCPRLKKSYAALYRLMGGRLLGENVQEAQMAYCLFRLFTEKQPDKHRMERLRSEMMPKIAKIPGFQRFAAFRTNDGRYGGFQVYETKDGPEQAVRLLNEWRERAGSKDPMSLELRGEVGLSIVVKPRFEKAHGMVRIYKTSAPFADVNAAIEREGGETIRKLHGMLRYTTVHFDDGSMAVFTACESEIASRAMAEKAKELRGKAGSQLAKLLPNDPEAISGEVLFSLTKSQVLAHA
jgi:hypothetical protein